MEADEKRRKAREKHREWVAKNREHVRAYQRAYMDAHPELREKARETARLWRIANPGRKSTRIERDPDDHRGRLQGEDHPNWKGDQAGYHAVHHWVVRQLGKPRLCKHCGSTNAKQFVWANVDHAYRRNLDEWVRLCQSCHVKFDYANNNRTRTRTRRRE